MGKGIKGAEAIASAIYLARNHSKKKEIKVYIEKEFDYNLSRTLDEIRPGYHHVETCQESVPEAITAFLEGKNFEDVIRNAVSLGGDTDTVACIAGSIAEAFYGIPFDFIQEANSRLPKEMVDVIDQFATICGRRPCVYFTEEKRQLKKRQIYRKPLRGVSWPKA